MRFLNTLFAILIVGLASCASEGEGTNNNVESKEVKSETTELSIPDGMYALTKVEPTVTWVAKKFTGSGHNGTINATIGKMKVENGNISGAVELDMKSFTCIDLEGEDKQHFDDHLKSADFLDVEVYPTSEVSILGIKGENGNLKASISLRMHGHDVQYETAITITPTELEDGSMTYVISGDLEIDRTKHKMIYGSGSFFDDLGDRAINDEVYIRFTFTAV